MAAQYLTEKSSQKPTTTKTASNVGEGLSVLSATVIFCNKITEAEAAVSVNEKKWLVMRMHVQCSRICNLPCCCSLHQALGHHMTSLPHPLCNSSGPIMFLSHRAGQTLGPIKQ